MSEDGYLNAKFKILELFSTLDDTELDSIEQWISSKSYKKDLSTKKSLMNTENMLVKIGNTIKKIVPFEAEMPSETIIPPTVGDQADCTEANTCHVDEFLYDENEVEELTKKGKLKRHYCVDCNSRNIAFCDSEIRKMINMNRIHFQSLKWFVVLVLYFEEEHKSMECSDNVVGDQGC